MAVTVHTFQLAYPEFRDTSYSLVQQKLDQARGRLNEAVFSDRWDEGVQLLAAHLLSISPQGEKSRFKTGQTQYNRELTQLKKVVTVGIGRLC